MSKFGWLARLMRLWLNLRYQRFGSRYNQLGLEEIRGVPLIVLPQVFNPVLLRTGRFMAETLAEWPFSGSERVLDLGCGSGVGAVFAAQAGAGSVLAVDINPAAVRSTQLNALLNGFERRISILNGNLFAGLGGQQFDLICFNPPFYRGQPLNPLDHAWRGEGVFERFVAGLETQLSPSGQVLLILSSDGDGDVLLELLNSAGFRWWVHRRQNLINEVLTAYVVQRS